VARRRRFALRGGRHLLIPRQSQPNVKCRRDPDLPLTENSDRKLGVRKPGSSFLLSCFSKNFFAALVECVAATVPHAFEQRLHLLEPLHLVPEFRDFSSGELVPAFRWTRPRREPEKELAYFLQREPRLSGALHDSETKKRTVVVAALAIPAQRRRENPDLLVVANGGGAQTKYARDIRNREVPCHSKI
jgi:hypothetical protein